MDAHENPPGFEPLAEAVFEPELTDEQLRSADLLMTRALIGHLYANASEAYRDLKKKLEIFQQDELLSICEEIEARAKR